MPLTRTLSIAGIIFLADRITKWIVVDYLDLAGRFYIEVFPPYINFAMAWNRGMNFGLFNGDNPVTRYVLIALAAIIVVGVIIWTRDKKGWLIPISSGLLIGGALGNVVDRFIYGAVADFLNVTCCGLNNPYAFNIADISIFAGAFGLLLWGDRKPSQ